MLVNHKSNCSSGGIFLSRLSLHLAQTLTHTMDWSVKKCKNIEECEQLLLAGVKGEMLTTLLPKGCIYKCQEYILGSWSCVE